MLARRCGKRPIVVPRRLHLGEAVDDHQLPIARRLDATGIVTLLEDADRLRRGDQNRRAGRSCATARRRRGAGQPGRGPSRLPRRPGRRVNWGRLFGIEKPNVKSLARSGDVDGLIQAARYREVVRRVDGRVSDAGASVREAAILALHRRPATGPARPSRRALRDPADRVRCAAVLALYERGEAEPLAEAAGLLRDEDGQALATAFRALLELRKPGSTLKLVQVIVYREDERPVSEVDASFLRALVEAEGPEARLRRRPARDQRSSRRARGRVRASGGRARAACPRQRGRLDGRAEGRCRAGTRRGGARADEGRARARRAGGGTPASRSQSARRGLHGARGAPRPGGVRAAPRPPRATPSTWSAPPPGRRSTASARRPSR